MATGTRPESLQNFSGDGKISAAIIVKSGEPFKRNDERKEKRTEGEKTPGTAGGCGAREKRGCRRKRAAVERGGSVCVEGKVCVCVCPCAKVIVTGDKENRRRMEKEKERGEIVGEEFQFLLENYLSCWRLGLEIIRWCNSTSPRIQRADYRTISLCFSISLSLAHTHTHSFLSSTKTQSHNANPSKHCCFSSFCKY